MKRLGENSIFCFSYFKNSQNGPQSPPLIFYSISSSSHLCLLWVPFSIGSEAHHSNCRRRHEHERQELWGLLFHLVCSLCSGHCRRSRSIAVASGRIESPYRWVVGSPALRSRVARSTEDHVTMISNGFPSKSLDFRINSKISDHPQVCRLLRRRPLVRRHSFAVGEAHLMWRRWEQSYNLKNIYIL